MTCPYRKSNPAIGTVICTNEEDKILSYMDWTPDKLDEFTLSLLEFPRDCPIKDDEKEQNKATDFVKQGEAIIDQLADIDNQIVEMQKSEHCYVNVGVIRKMIAGLKTEIEDMIYNSKDGD